MLLRPLAVLTMLTIGLGFAPAAWAQNYVVKDVKVSATAANATEARVNALAQGEKKGFEKLMRELLPEAEANARIAKTENWQISRMVRSYEVNNERLSGTSYHATLDIIFDPQQVKQVVAGVDAAAPAATPAPGYPAAAPARTSQPAGTIAAPTVLVLPVFYSPSNKPLLWEEENTWRNAWNHAERGGTNYVRLPLGDQSDQSMLTARQAQRGDSGNVGLIAERYQSDAVLVAEARLFEHAEPIRLDVTLRRTSRTGAPEAMQMSYEAPYEENAEQLMARAAQDIASKLTNQGQTAQSTLQQQQQSMANRVTILTRLTRLSDWVNIRRRLEALPMVSKVELAAISSQQADIVVHFRGAADQLAGAMSGQGMRVEQANQYWVVSY